MVSGTERETNLDPKRATKVQKAGQSNDNGRKLYLVGFMASGKSQLGRRLSALLDCPLYDTDLCIAQQTGMSVPEIFARRGETWFREAESRLIRSLPDEACVVVTGGGLPCREDEDGRNFIFCQKQTKGKRIFLQAGRTPFPTGRRGLCVFLAVGAESHETRHSRNNLKITKIQMP